MTLKLKPIVVLILLLLSSATFMSAQTIVETGRCGNNISWTLDNKGVLTFSSDKVNTEFCVSSFQKPRNKYSTVVIGNNITRIYNEESTNAAGWTVFPRKFDSAKNVIIGNSVTCIGNYAFAECGELESITIGENVREFQFRPFVECDKLEKVNITNLKKWCGIKFDTDFYNFNNPLRWAANLYINGVEATDVVIPEGVKRIGECAFLGCKNLKTIKIPESVKTIGDGAFGDCDNLASVEIYKSQPNNSIKLDYPSVLKKWEDTFHDTAMAKQFEIEKTKEKISNNSEASPESNEAMEIYTLGTWNGKSGNFSVTITFNENKTYTATVKYARNYAITKNGKKQTNSTSAVGTFSGRWNIPTIPWGQCGNAIVPIYPKAISCTATNKLNNTPAEIKKIRNIWLRFVKKAFNFNNYSEDCRFVGSSFSSGYDHAKKKQTLEYSIDDENHQSNQSFVLYRVSSPFIKSGSTNK